MPMPTGLQFGRDLIFTWGPWGFLCSLLPPGPRRGRPDPSLADGGPVRGRLRARLAHAAARAPGGGSRSRPSSSASTGSSWTPPTSSSWRSSSSRGMMDRGASAARLVAWALVLGFLAQLKFTYMVLASAGVLAAAACWVGRGYRGRALGAAAGFAAAVFGAWVAAGQNPDNLYPYLRRSLEIASAYGDAMGIDEPWPAFACGAGLALACAALAWTAWRRIPERAFAAGACGYLAFSLLVMWKESFTRADLLPLGGHVFGFFVYVLCLAPVVPSLIFPGRRWHWSDLAVPGCLAAVACFDPELLRAGTPGRVGAHLRERQGASEAWRASPGVAELLRGGLRAGVAALGPCRGRRPDRRRLRLQHGGGPPERPQAGPEADFPELLPRTRPASRAGTCASTSRTARRTSSSGATSGSTTAIPDRTTPSSSRRFRALSRPSSRGRGILAPEEGCAGPEGPGPATPPIRAEP